MEPDTEAMGNATRDVETEHSDEPRAQSRGETAFREHLPSAETSEVNFIPMLMKMPLPEMLGLTNSLLQGVSLRHIGETCYDYGLDMPRVEFSPMSEASETEPRESAPECVWLDVLEATVGRVLHSLDDISQLKGGGAALVEIKDHIESLVEAREQRDA